MTVLPSHVFARPRPLDVPAGATALRVELHPSANPVLTVLGPEGRPASGATGRVSAPDAPDQMDDPFDEHRIAGGTTDAAGVVRLRGLDPRERYRLEVSFPLGRSDLRGAVRHDWLPREETITLSRK